MHRWNCHGQRNPPRELILCNECPLCRKVFASVRATGEHLIRSGERGRRVARDTSKVRAVLVEAEEVTCSVCGETVRGHGAVQRHMARHAFERLAERGGWEGERWWERGPEASAAVQPAGRACSGEAEVDRGGSAAGGEAGDVRGDAGSAARTGGGQCSGAAGAAGRGSVRQLTLTTMFGVTTKGFRG